MSDKKEVDRMVDDDEGIPFSQGPHRTGGSRPNVKIVPQNSQPKVKKPENGKPKDK